MDDTNTNTREAKMTNSIGRKLWTITYVAKGDESELQAVVRGDTASHAKNQLRNRREVQYVKNSREFSAATDAKVERI